MCRYGYARVSSKGQQRDGYGLDVQVNELRSHGCTDIRAEVFTGMTLDRPELNRLTQEAKRGDTIVFPRMDRLSRSTMEGLRFFEDMERRGIEVEVIGLGVMAGGPMSTAFRAVALVFAQLDHDQIVSRLAEGRAKARATNPGYREGRRPAFGQDDERFRQMLDMVNRNERTVRSACEELGISRATWYRTVNRYGK